MASSRVGGEMGDGEMGREVGGHEFRDWSVGWGKPTFETKLITGKPPPNHHHHHNRNQTTHRPKVLRPRVEQRQPPPLPALPGGWQGLRLYRARWLLRVSSSTFVKTNCIFCFAYIFGFFFLRDGFKKIRKNIFMVCALTQR